MPIQSIETDAATLTLTAIGHYPVPVERLWDAMSDPRKLERFWGPPSWPATFTEHRLEVDQRSQYFMTGPHGETSRGYWIVQEVDPGKRFVVRDGFANEDGTPNTAFPETTLVVTLASTDAGSTFTAVTTFASVESMEQLLKMGMLEGLTSAIGQLDAVLADLRDLAAGFPTELVRLEETTALVERVVRGPMSLVWRAHNEKTLLQQWMLGPDGWTMPVCQVAAQVGESYRYEWENAVEGQSFGFEGELLESEPPYRAVTTERMIGMEGPGTRNELTLTPLPGNRTRVTVRIDYPSAELREMVLGTGMVDGMDVSYSRLERVIA
jgi:uncharacterized protein YndB with AHSA1/START domain